MRTIGAVTAARSDYGIYVPVFRAIEAEPPLNLRLIVTGMHLSPEFGLTVREIEADGFEIREKVEMLLSSDTPEAVSKSIGLGTIGFAQLFSRWKPDILVVLGDRFEMYAAALAALPFKIPVAHIHGGELTEGAIDDALRHSMTKLSHLHFVSTETYARRVRQLGEEGWRVVLSGAPSLDNLASTKLLPPDALDARFGIRLADHFLLVTYHPVTLEYERTESQMRELLAALETIDWPVVFTIPNADTGGRVIIRLVEEFVTRRPRAQFVANLGTQGYFSLMQLADAMVGNSSSGLVEAPSFRLPVVNIGTRQRGRVRAENVIDVGYNRMEIVGGIRRALAPEFRKSLRDVCNPYGQGNAAQVIVRNLCEIALDERLIAKRFVDVPVATRKTGPI